MNNKFITILLGFLACIAFSNLTQATTYYVAAYSGGNNSDGGTSISTAFNNMTYGCTASVLSAGDEIRIEKSPDPTIVGNGTIDYGNRTIILENIPVATITMCETKWTNATSVTTATVSGKEGSYAASITPQSAFTTGKMAYVTFSPALNLSAYQQISFWISSTSSLAAGVLTVSLCSDATGDTPVDSITNSFPLDANNAPVSFDVGHALPSSVGSIALYANSDPATPTIVIDDVFAAKAKTEPDSITLTSLIGDTGEGRFVFGHPWYAIQSINETKIVLDSYPGESASQDTQKTSVWLGKSGLQTIYKRECVMMNQGSQFGSTLTFVENGTINAYLKYSGGWNFTTGLQDGMTWFSGRTVGFIGSYSYISLSDVGLCLRYNAQPLQMGTNFSFLRNIDITGSYTSTSKNTLITSGYVENIMLHGNNSTSGTAYFGNIVYGNNVLTQGDTYDVNSANAGIQNISNFYALNKLTGTPTYFVSAGGTPPVNTMHASFGVLSPQGTVFKSTVQYMSAPESVVFNPSTYAVSPLTLRYSLGQVVTTAGHPVTVSAWIYKTAASGNNARIYIDSCLNGISYASATDTTGWQNVSFTYTPTTTGIADILGCVEYVSSTASVYFDDVTVSVGGSPRYVTSNLNYVSGTSIFNPNAQGLTGAYTWGQ